MQGGRHQVVARVQAPLERERDALNAAVGDGVRQGVEGDRHHVVSDVVRKGALQRHALKGKAWSSVTSAVKQGPLHHGFYPGMQQK